MELTLNLINKSRCIQKAIKYGLVFCSLFLFAITNRENVERKLMLCRESQPNGKQREGGNETKQKSSKG
jgi:hypothetical protein